MITSVLISRAQTAALCSSILSIMDNVLPHSPVLACVAPLLTAAAFLLMHRSSYRIGGKIPLIYDNGLMLLTLS